MIHYKHGDTVDTEVSAERIMEAVDCLHAFILKKPGKEIDGTMLAKFYEDYPSHRFVFRQRKLSSICEYPYAHGKILWIQDESLPGKGKVYAIQPQVKDYFRVYQVTKG